MKSQNLSPLDELLFFTKTSLLSLSSDSTSTLDTTLQRWTQAGVVIRLKNGLYATKTSFDLHKNTPGYREYLANVLCSPSYLSLEYVLSLHDVLTEASYPLTSVTQKTGRSFENLSGVYLYKQLDKRLFIGFEAKQFLQYQYLSATKAKALFDYLYYKVSSLADDDKSRNMYEELRLKLDGFDQSDRQQLIEYGTLSGNAKLERLITNILAYAPNHL